MKMEDTGGTRVERHKQKDKEINRKIQAEGQGDKQEDTSRQTERHNQKDKETNRKRQAEGQGDKQEDTSRRTRR